MWCAGSWKKHQSSKHTDITDLIESEQLNMVTDKMPCITKFDRSYQVIIYERQDWDQGEPSFLKKDITWYTEGSRSNQGTGAGM